MYRALTQGKNLPADFSTHIRQDLIAHKESKSLKEKPHLANGQILTRIAYQDLGMIDELPKAVSQDQVSHEVGPMKIKPVSMIIPPREKSKRTLYKKGRPAREEAGASAGGAEQMPEEPSIPPLSETHKRREVERMFEAVRRAREMGPASTYYKRKEKTVDPERRTKTKEDPREVEARGEREETVQA